MTLTAGARLGPYEILAAIGAGGMGQVFKARDTRLNRTVAIKTLAADFVSHTDWKQRFEREAQTVAALNHPHICVLHDVGEQDGIDYLVMEYLDGDTLAQRLEKGPLPIEQALRIAIDIADALEKAHRQGVTHRDLKPGNIMLTSGGAKLLDFGLAKQRSGPVASHASRAQTQDGNLTGAGTILGTMQYMAPEQLEGLEADARTDIFALGTVIYEMVAGRRAFAGNSQASLIASIMTSEPPAPSSLQKVSPASLDRVLKRCMAKRPDQRWQSAGDLTYELEWIATGTADANPIVADAKASPKQGWLWKALAGALAVALIAAVVLIVRNDRPSSAGAALMNLSIDAPAGATFTRVQALSPDGKRIAFVARGEDGKTALWLRSLDSPNAQPLRGTDAAIAPFWSPDSRYIGFFSGARLKTIDVASGALQDLVEATSVSASGAWNKNGIIVFATTVNNNGVLARLPAGGGKPEILVTLDASRHENNVLLPDFLPDGRHFIYSAQSTTPSKSSIRVASIDSKENKVLTEGGVANPRYSMGYLLYNRGFALVAQPFDANRLELSGEPVALTDEILNRASVSDGGLLAYYNGSVNTQVVEFDRSGRELEKVSPAGRYVNVNLSPDGKTVAAGRNEDGQRFDIWLLDLTRKVPTRFTSDPERAFAAVWSPDSKTIAFLSNRDNGEYHIYQKLTNGAGNDEAFDPSSGYKVPSSWSLDGKYMVYDGPSAQSPRGGIWMLPLFGDRKAAPFIATNYLAGHGEVSPDGHWIAYESTQTGSYEIYVQSFPAPEARVQVTSGGGVQPRWRRDGKELFYLAPTQDVMAAPISLGSDVQVGKSTTLFRTRISGGASGGIGLLSRHEYDVSADGQRFFINVVPQTADIPITLVVNWPSLLKKK